MARPGNSEMNKKYETILTKPNFLVKKQHKTKTLCL